jgi:DNA-binding MarR family transcriptional regulator
VAKAAAHGDMANVSPAPERAASAERPGSEEITLGVLDGFIGFYLRLAQDASFRAFAQRSGRRDLKPGRFAAMMVIHNNPGVTPTALGRATARDKSSITPLLQALERQGLIVRRSTANDGRSYGLTLTSAGETRLRALLAHAMDHDRKLDQIVGAGKDAFVQILRRIAQEMG